MILLHLLIQMEIIKSFGAFVGIYGRNRKNRKRQDNPVSFYSNVYEVSYLR